MKISTLTPGQVRGEGQLGFRRMDGFREPRAVDYNLYKGRHYMRSGGSSGDRQPVNSTQQLIRTLTSFVAMNAPLTDVTPTRADLEFEAQVRKSIHDKQAQDMRLDEVYQDAATEAIISGLAFTLNGIKSGGDTYAAGNRRLPMGQEFTKLLNGDDITLDPMSNSLDAMRLFGHRYPVSKAEAIEAIMDGAYGATPEDYDDGLLPNPYIATPEEAAQILEACTVLESNATRGNRVDENDEPQSTGEDRLDETILLWDMYLYMHGEVWVVTLPAEPGQAEVFSTPGGIDKFLACYRWNGPASGPVNRLTFFRVPFNKIPLALAQMQRDLGEILDLLSNKTFRQLMRTMQFVVYDGSAENMAMAMKRSAEGGYIRGNPKSVANVKSGGLIPEMMPGTQYFADQWQQATGNLAMAAGTGDLGKTATAFEGLMGRIQSFLDFLRMRVEQLATDDLNVRKFYLDNNPAWQKSIPQTIGQGPGAITTSVQVANPGAPMAPQADYVMQGGHQDFEMKCRAFSMAYQNPQISAQQFQQAIATVVPAIIEMMPAGLDGRTAMKTLARKLNTPELENLLPDPVTQMLEQQEQMAAQATMDDPTGQGLNTDPVEGPTGRKIPGGANKRAMNPGPGQGAPRPMGPQPQPMRMKLQGAAA